MAADANQLQPSGIKEADSILASFGGITPEPPIPNNVHEMLTGIHYARGMEAIERRQRYKDGRRQTDAEHSWRLGFMSVYYAGTQRDDLDVWAVQAMCHAHDLKEIYSGDTPINDPILLESKKAREVAGLFKLLGELGNNPFMHNVILQYEEAETPEARFVHAMDKYEPILFDLENEGTTYRYHRDVFPELVRMQLPKTITDSHVFHRMVRAFIDIGERWHDWECVPFSGEPEEIVNGVRDMLIKQKPDLRVPVQHI